MKDYVGVLIGGILMKRIIYAIVILFVVLGVEHAYDSYSHKRTEKDEIEVSAVVENVFENAGIYESECEIDGYFYYGPMYLSDDGCHELLSRLAGLIGVNSEYEYRRERTDTGYDAVLIKDAKYSRLELKMITVENEENENLIGQHQYLSVNLKIQNSVNSGFYYRKMIADSVEKIIEESEVKYEDLGYDYDRRHNLVDTLSVGIKGKIYGYMNLDKQKEIAGEIAAGMKAELVFDNVESKPENVDNRRENTDDLYSLYAYTDEINDYVSVGMNKININIAFSYNEDDNVTYVNIGSPIVNYDY